MKILVDADWILELFVNRYQYRTEAKKLFSILQNQSLIEVFVTEFCLDKIRYFLGSNNSQLGQDAVSWIKKTLNNCILSVDNNVRDDARNLFINDFESAIEVALAKQEKMQAIITLNPENFAGANLPIFSSEELLVRLSLEQIWNRNNSPALFLGDLKTIKFINNLIEKDINYLQTSQQVDLEFSNANQVHTNFCNEKPEYDLQQEIQRRRQDFLQEMQIKEHHFQVLMGKKRRKAEQDLKNYQRFLDSLEDLREGLEAFYPDIPCELTLIIHDYSTQLFHKMWESSDGIKRLEY